MRLHKYMALCGVASRRKSEVIIQEGRVEVNGTKVNSSAIPVDEFKDVVKVDGKLIQMEENKVYIMLNKPLDCVTTSSDQFGRTTVLDYIEGIDERIYPVGRLDYNTTGLLLLTNDGDLAKKIMHPSSHLSKIYVAKVKDVPTESKLKEFRTGINIEDRMTSPAKIEVLKDRGDFSIVKVEIYEGRNRQVRKMLDAIGHPVITLKRVAIGTIELGDLEIGTFRNLTSDEINYLKEY